MIRKLFLRNARLWNVLVLAAIGFAFLVEASHAAEDPLGETKGIDAELRKLDRNTSRQTDCRDREKIQRRH